MKKNKVFNRMEKSFVFYTSNDVSVSIRLSVRVQITSNRVKLQNRQMPETDWLTQQIAAIRLAFTEPPAVMLSIKKDLWKLENPVEKNRFTQKTHPSFIRTCNRIPTYHIESRKYLPGY